MKERQPMQISRHWRLNGVRYRLQGYKYEDGTYSLQARRKFQESETPGKEPIEVKDWPKNVELNSCLENTESSK